MFERRSRRGRPGRTCGLCAVVVVVASGCQQIDLQQSISADEQREFRAEAVQLLKDMAFSEDPRVTFQAIEAFRDVAPDVGTMYIVENARSSHSGVAASALMALGTLRCVDQIELMRTKAEHTDPNVQIAAIYAMHCCGDQRRTGDLARFLLHHPKARVRANAALALGRLGEPESIKVLRMALRRERKSLTTHHIYESLALLGDGHGIERLLFLGYSADVNDATEAVMMLANARCEEAEDLFRDRLTRAELAETKLHAARGLGRIGAPNEWALDLALRHLFFKSPRRNLPDDPPDRQIRRIRSLAALALEALGNPDALGALRSAYTVKGQDDPVRVAIARAAIGIIDRNGGRPEPPPSASDSALSSADGSTPRMQPSGALDGG